MRPRTYRAHGRINSSCHIKICLVEKEQTFDRGSVEMPEKKKVSKKKLKKQNVAASCAKGSL